MHTVNHHLGLVLQTKKRKKKSYTENYFDAFDFVSLLCSQGVIILDELRLLEQTVS